MKRLYIVLFFVVYGSCVYAQAPANDNIDNAVTITNIFGYCSSDAAYSSVNATASGFGKAGAWGSAGNDVWFKFTAQRFDVSVTVTGQTGTSSNTLVNPLVAIYEYDAANKQIFESNGSMTSINNTTEAYRGALEIGKAYYIRVSAENNNTGTFKICVNNYTPPVKAGQDCATASVLCSKETISVKDISGRGNTAEGQGTCLGPETNSAWYSWTAANNGTLSFIITPTVETNDIDWALYDAGVNGSCSNVVSTSKIRCASGSGVNCTPRYFKTGLSLSSTDIEEQPGCVQGQDGFVQYITIQQGHTYYLIVDNVSSGTGFNLEFGGTGEFLGPQAKIDLTINNPCTVNQNYVFKSLSTNYTSLKWTFGDGASTATATGEGPFTISYSTPGIKTAVLEAIGDKGCLTVDTRTFIVGLKPATPLVNSDKAKYCLKENIVLTTPPLQDATYAWTGPDGFTSNERVPTVPVNNYGAAGPYFLTVTINGCTSDAASITVVIGKTPVVNFDITENNICTTAQSFTFTNRSADFQRLNWDFGATASIATATTDQQFTITYSSPGTKIITLLEEGDTGCIVTLTKTIDVPVVPPTPVIQVNKPDFCLKDTIRLSTDVLPNTTYLWSGPANFTSDQPVINIPVNSFAVSGTYSLSISQGRCSSTVVSVIVPPILKNPTAAFIADPSLPAKLAFPVNVKFTNRSADADTYLWDFGDGSTSTDFSPEHEYTSIGEFDVTLTAFKSDVCSASVTQGKFVVRADNTIFIPNTFTPNGDGINDEFVITLLNLRSYRILIFNRWGEQLFQTSNIFENWKGISKSGDLPVGTYYYLITAIDIKGNAVKKSGPVTIIR